MLYDLYRKQKTSPQKAMEGQFLFGIYRLEEWKGLVEAFGFSPGTLVELDHMDESRTLHKLDSYYGYCFGFVHPLKVRKEAAAGIGLYCRQREVILISENTDQLLDFFRLLQQLPAAQLSAEHILSLFFEYLLKKHKEEHETGFATCCNMMSSSAMYARSCWRMKTTCLPESSCTIFASVPIGWNGWDSIPAPCAITVCRFVNPIRRRWISA